MRNLTAVEATALTGLQVQMIDPLTGNLDKRAPTDLFGAVEQYPAFANFPAEGKENVLYVDKSSQPYQAYVWSNSSYIAVGDQNMNVLPTAQPTPTASGNTTNLMSVFKDVLGDTWIVDRQGDAIKAGTSPFKHQKEWHVDPNGLDTNSGAEDAPFKTLAYAATKIGSTGEKLVIHPGTYTENVTFPQLNIDVVGESGTTAGLCYIKGTVTFTGGVSSSRFANITADTIVHSGAASLYLNEAQTKTSLNKTGSGYLEVLDSDILSANITGAGQVVFQGGKQTLPIVNNANAVVTFRNSINTYALNVLAGTVATIGGINMAATATGPAVTASAGTTVIMSSVSNYGNAGAITSVSLAGNYSLDDVVLNKTASTLGTNMGIVSWFNDIGLVNVPTITGATKTLVRDANGVLSEQIISSGALTTTSLTPQFYDGTTFVGAQVGTDPNEADLLLLSDGSRIHGGKVTWTGHGLTVGNWYYTSQTTAGAYVTPAPTSGLVQQLFFVEDANTIHVDVNQADLPGGDVTPPFEPTKMVYVNSTSPATATIFDLANPPVTNDDSLKADTQNLYVGSNGSLWQYNTATATYTTYTYPATVKHAVFAKKSVTQTGIPGAGAVVTAWDAPTTNTAGTAAFNAATGVFTCQRAGYYNISARLFFASASWTLAGIAVGVTILVKGVAAGTARMEHQAARTAQVNTGTAFVGPVYLVVGDTVSVSAFHGETTARSLLGTSGNNQWSIWEI